MLDKRLDHESLHSYAKGAYDYLDTIDDRTSHLGDDSEEITVDSKLRIRLEAAMQAVAELDEHLCDQYNEEFDCPGHLQPVKHYELEIR